MLPVTSPLDVQGKTDRLMCAGGSRSAWQPTTPQPHMHSDDALPRQAHDTTTTTAAAARACSFMKITVLGSCTVMMYFGFRMKLPWSEHPAALPSANDHSPLIT